MFVEVTTRFIDLSWNHPYTAALMIFTAATIALYGIIARVPEAK